MKAARRNRGIDVDFCRPGDKACVDPPRQAMKRWSIAYSDLPFRGQIANVDSAGRSAATRGRLSDSDSRLKTGMLFTVETGIRHFPPVPRSALTGGARARFVRGLAGGGDR